MRKKVWILLTRYFSGECTPEEMETIRQWKDASQKNTMLFEKLSKDREIFNSYRKMKQVNVDRAWNNVFQRIRVADDKGILQENIPQHARNTTLFPVFIKIAASVIVIIGIYFAIRFIAGESSGRFPDYVSTYSSDNSTVVNLSDGSKVYLNANAEIRYPREFDSGIREVVLNGEAFFEVAHDAGKPFIVDAGKARIKVLGTSFLVTEHSQHNVDVYVESGRVAFFKENHEEKRILLKPGYIGTINRNSTSIKPNTDENIIAWKTKKLVFNNADFDQILRVLSEVYNVRIELVNPEKINCRHTDTYYGRSLEYILRVLSTNQYRFDVEHKPDKLVITMHGCSK